MKRGACGDYEKRFPGQGSLRWYQACDQSDSVTVRLYMRRYVRQVIPGSG